MCSAEFLSGEHGSFVVFGLVVLTVIFSRNMQTINEIAKLKNGFV
jgi:hypothetical protein